MPERRYANASEDEPLKPFKFTRRQTGPKDVHLQITNCGICHSDLHTVYLPPPPPPSLPPVCAAIFYFLPGAAYCAAILLGSLRVP